MLAVTMSERCVRKNWIIFKFAYNANRIFAIFLKGVTCSCCESRC